MFFLAEKETQGQSLTEAIDEELAELPELSQNQSKNPLLEKIFLPRLDRKRSQANSESDPEAKAKDLNQKADKSKENKSTLAQRLVFERTKKIF